MTHSELMILKNTAAFASKAEAARNSDELCEALSSMALVFGHEARLRRIVADPSSDTTARELARQILTAISPKETDLTVPLSLPLKRPILLRRNLVPLAERIVSAAVRDLTFKPDSQFIIEAIGVRRLLEEASANLLSIERRGEYLIECCRRIEEAYRTGNFTMATGYEPIPDLQMKFDFGERFA